jgi:biotin operon repressor
MKNLFDDDELINTSDINNNSMAVKDDVLKAMKKSGKPMSAGEVEKATGADRKAVDQAFKELKAEGAIVSPVRCKWEPVKK